MMDDPEVKAIICARGGYGTVRVMEHLDFSTFQNHPKWIIGYSDITVLHSFVSQQLGIKTLHATMPLNITMETIDSPSTHLLWKALFGHSVEFTWTSNTITSSFQRISGELTGGNLSVLYSLRGTKYDISTDNKILFIEDLDEYLYHIDRMVMNLKTGDKLKNLKALIVGGMTDMNDNRIPFGQDAKEIIKDNLSNVNYPVIFDCPVGHMKDNYPLIIGDQLTLEQINKNEVKIFSSG
jgi:muramoyltetrapeptide carboxypeptidase